MRKQSGGIDSKYYYNPSQLEIDLVAKEQQRIDFQVRLTKLLLEQPDRLDINFHLAIDTLKEIKEQFNL